jgi:hypothetical protein
MTRRDSREIELKHINELFEMLTGGELPNGVSLGEQPNLTPRAAQSVIWFLQEHCRVLPSKFDRCDNCGEWYNADESGLGHIDPTDDWLWKETGYEWLTKERVQSVAHQHFCDFDCLDRYIWKMEDENDE